MSQRNDGTTGETGTGTWRQTLDRVIPRIPLLTNGEALVGLTFALAGLLVMRQGIGKLGRLIMQVKPFLPFSAPADLTGWMSMNLPLAFSAFIWTVAAISAVLVGLLWVIAGVAEAIESRKISHEPQDFLSPHLAAESLRTGLPQGWERPPLVRRLLGRIWPAARFMSPVSYEIFMSRVTTLWKLVFLWIAIAVAVKCLSLIPNAAKAFFNRDIMLLTPSAGRLYTLLLCVGLAEVIIALTLVPFRRRDFTRRFQVIPVRGHGDPSAFFALLEEGCRLLTRKGDPDRKPGRLQATGRPRVKATLVETFPELVRSLARPAAYSCLPLALILISNGFRRLVNFQQPTQPMPYADFLSRYLPVYGMDIAFAFGLILAGLHFGQCARVLFGPRSYRSVLVFCHVSEAGAMADSLPESDRLPTPGDVHRPTTWEEVNGVDEQFANWARQPDSQGTFLLNVCWAEVRSESSAPESPRHLVRVEAADKLERAMARILELPFRVHFHVDHEAVGPTGPLNDHRPAR